MNHFLLVIVGLILGILLGCNYRTKYKAPDSNIIRKKIFKYKGKKYKFIPSVVLYI